MLAVLKGVQDKKDVTISSVPYAIGRCRTADFIIVDVNVSRNHCQIVKENEKWKINDFSSSGTYVNNVLVGKGKSVFLKNEDCVRFGPIENKLCWIFQSIDSSHENSSVKHKTNEAVNLEKCHPKDIESNKITLGVEEKLVSEEKQVPLENNNFKRTTTEAKHVTRSSSKILNPQNESEINSKKEENVNEKSESEKIKELTKELQEVHNALNDLEEKNSALQVELAAGAKVKTETNPVNNLMENLADLMEAEFQCTICSEIFVTAVTLSCTHTFCKYCINQWKKKQKTCPICRKKITNETRSLVVDNYIDKVVGNLSPELKERRDIIIRERETPEPCKKKSKLKK